LSACSAACRDRWKPNARIGPGAENTSTGRSTPRGFEATGATPIREKRRHADGDPDPGGDAQRQLLPVVRYANRAARRQRRRLLGPRDAAGAGVIARDREEATAGAHAALAAVREPWEPESTAYNLSLIRDARATRQERIDWADAIERELLDAAKKR
jgi:hypothetical protein